MSDTRVSNVTAGSPAEKRVLIVAGEASGDLYGGRLIREVTRLAPGVSFFGVGGASMREAGLSALCRSEDITVVGLFEVIRHLGVIRRALKAVTESIRTTRPDLVLLIDFPDFNFRVARAAAKSGVRVFYYISPQVWAWRRGRVKTLARLVDKMIVIFPFEVDIYKEAGVDVEFLGHPLVDVVRGRLENLTIEKKGNPVIALLPGSRKGEIERHMPVMCEAARIIRDKVPNASFTMPLAPTLVREDVQHHLADCPVPIAVREGAFHEVVKSADVAVVSSGTATVETALLTTPMVVIYRLNPLTFFLARRLIRVPYIAMVNLVSSRRVVPELIQDEASAEGIAREVLTILNDNAVRDRMKQDLREVGRIIGEPGASERIAHKVVEFLYHEG
ncbi:MAG: lipid-A-disaccharide synthase [Deltaproteobacteria bacterium]|nr:lipid-A-disaccharide synthase [Candidatus Zymogenaceae bacterium]